MRSIVLQLMLLLLAAGLAGCQPAPPPASDAPVTLRLLTHDSFAVSESVLAAFTAQTGHRVELVRAGDAGQIVNQSILTQGNPLGDVLFGLDNTFLSRALANDLLLPYQSPLLADIDPALLVDPTWRALPVDFGDVCLNYDVGWFVQNGVRPPATLDDLIDPAYADLTVVTHPATSSPGLAFLLATVVRYGEAGFRDYWAALAANGVRVESGWENAYYGAFTRYGGDRPIVVSYASSPPAEVYFAESPPASAPTAAVTADGSCFRQIEFVGVLAGTPHVAAAQQLVDFLLSPPFQSDIPLNMFVFPANVTVALPDVFVQHAAVPDNPATLPPDVISANRDAWIAAWNEIVVRAP